MPAVDWEEVDDILFDGTPEEIVKIKCPDCGGVLSYSYARFEDDNTASSSLWCNSCPILIRSNIGSKRPTPNCVEFYGAEFKIDANLKLKAIA